MIHKTIHYCWFGGNPLPELAVKCIDSWKKFCPDYKIKEWNENNFDVNQNRYCKEAYEAKKFAFVSDYARFDIIYRFGGVYLDVDVELLKNLDNLLDNDAYIGIEGLSRMKKGKVYGVNAGLGFGAVKEFPLIKDFLDSYQSRKFCKENGEYDYTTIVEIVTEILIEKGYKSENTFQEIEGCKIYPTEYLCPKDYETAKLKLTANSVSIHHFDGSWLNKERKVFMKYIQKYGIKRGKMLMILLHPILALRLKKRKI